MSLAENVAAAILVFILVLVITVIIYGGLSSTKYFGRVMFRNKQAEREFRQRQQEGGEVLERFRAIDQQGQSNPGGGGGRNFVNQASQTSDASHGSEQQQTEESQHQQTEESQQEQTTEASQVSEVSAPTPTSSTVAEAGR